MSKPRILVVDDHPANLKLISFFLGAKGMDVVTAKSAAEAREVLATVTPDVILMDIQLPEVDGLTFTRELRGEARWATVPIVAVTAYAMAQDERAAREAGCDDFVSKPIQTAVLLETVRRMLDRATGAGQP